MHKCPSVLGKQMSRVGPSMNSIQFMVSSVSRPGHLQEDYKDSTSKEQLGQEIEKKNGSLCSLYLKLQGVYHLVDR